VDVDRYVPQAVSRGDGFRVGYIGTFGRGQGLLAVVEAAALLATRSPDVRFSLVGDGPERELLRSAILERRLTNIEISPPIPREETVAFYNGCDVCLVPLAPIPIFQETIPSKIFEVMACGRPLIASLEGEGAKIVADSGGGVTTAPGSGSEMADAILSVRRMQPEARIEMGKRARAYAIRNYDRRNLAEAYMALLKSL
jgi:glycosyltransferase involved in cell wall biosynthesis